MTHPIVGNFFLLHFFVYKELLISYPHFIYSPHRCLSVAVSILILKNLPATKSFQYPVDGQLRGTASTLAKPVNNHLWYVLPIKINKNPPSFVSSNSWNQLLHLNALVFILYVERVDHAILNKKTKWTRRKNITWHTHTHTHKKKTPQQIDAPVLEG